MKHFILKRQLHHSGARDTELSSLLDTANMLEKVDQPALSSKTYDAIKEIPGKPSHIPLVMKISMGGAFAACAALLVVSHFATPNSPLYGLKKETEKIRAFVQPSYKDAIVDERKKELDLLEEKQVAPEIIDKVRLDYESALKGSSNKKQEIERQREHRSKVDADNDHDSTKRKTREDSWHRGGETDRNQRDDSSRHDGRGR